MMRTAVLKGFLAASALALGVFADAEARAADITGAGATFPYPIYAKWADAYKTKTGNGLNYQSIGSGGGIAQIKAKTVDFGASDMPLKPDDLKTQLMIFRLTQSEKKLVRAVAARKHVPVSRFIREAVLRAAERE